MGKIINTANTRIKKTATRPKFLIVSRGVDRDVQVKEDDDEDDDAGVYGISLSSYTEINIIFGAPCTYMWSWPLQSLSQLVQSFFCLHLQSERRPMCKPSS